MVRSGVGAKADTALPKILGHGEKEGDSGEAHDEMGVSLR